MTEMEIDATKELREAPFNCCALAKGFLRVGSIDVVVSRG
jgi:hypothetical protein